MTTHLRARALQAGAMVALVGGMLVVASSPAQANAPTVAITEISTNMQSGDKTTFKYNITNNNSTSTSFRVQVSGMDCSQACSSVVTLEGGAAREFVKTLTAPQVDPGDDESVEVAVEATAAAVPPESDDAKQTVQVRGADKPQTVRQISGRVRDSNGKAISGAQVILQDSANHKYDTTSNNSGAYSFTSADDKPIVPGQVSIGAGKDGFKPAAISVQAAAGKSVNAPSLNLTSTVAVASPTPSATEGASSPPVDEATDDAADPGGETAGAADPASGEDSSSSSLLFIILGGLLVAAGIGAIVLVLMRRRGNDDDGADLPGGAIPPSKGGGRYGNATQVAAPVGARANDATMVASMSGPPLSMSDAPTTLLQSPIPADDEFPDPYGAPAQVAHGGYTPVGAGSYDANAQVPVQGGYEDEYARPATQYGRPAQQQEEYGGYVPSAADQRYDEQTGMYRAEPAYEEPAYEEPVYEQPAYGQPAYEEPAYQEPAGSAGGYPGAAYGQPQPDDYGPPTPEPVHGSWDAPAEGGNTYGAAPAAGVYGGRAQSSAGGAPAPNGGGAGAYGAPAGGGTYGAAAPGGNGAYGAAGGYEVPVSPQRGGTYGGAPSYGGDQGGYDPRATYGRPDGHEPAPNRGGQQGVYGGGPAGYDQGGRDQGGHDQGGYDQSGRDQGGYDQGGRGQGGYDQSGYDQSGHDQNGYDQSGYDRGGYDQQGARRQGGPARPEPTPPGQRRPVDWLDD